MNSGDLGKGWRGEGYQAVCPPLPPDTLSISRNPVFLSTRCHISHQDVHRRRGLSRALERKVGSHNLFLIPSSSAIYLPHWIFKDFEENIFF